jgi:chromosome segregation ATPase
MPGPVAREEFDELADEVSGEKTVTRHILEQSRRNGDDIAALKSRVGRVEEKVDALDRRVEGLDRKVESLDRQVQGLRVDLHGLRDSLPRIVGDTMRDVLREDQRQR